MAQGLEEADIVIGNKNNAEILPKLRRYLSSHERMIDIEQHCTGEKFYKTSINAFFRTYKSNSKNRRRL